MDLEDRRREKRRREESFTNNRRREESSFPSYRDLDRPNLSKKELRRSQSSVDPALSYDERQGSTETPPFTDAYDAHHARQGFDSSLASKAAGESAHGESPPDRRHTIPFSSTTQSTHSATKAPALDNTAAPQTPPPGYSNVQSLCDMILSNAEHLLRFLNPTLCNGSEHPSNLDFRLIMLFEDGKYAAMVTFRLEHQMIRGRAGVTIVEALELLHKDIASALAERVRGGMEMVDCMRCPGGTLVKWEPDSFRESG